MSEITNLGSVNFLEDVTAQEKTAELFEPVSEKITKMIVDVADEIVLKSEGEWKKIATADFVDQFSINMKQRTAKIAYNSHSMLSNFANTARDVIAKRKVPSGN